MSPDRVGPQVGPFAGMLLVGPDDEGPASSMRDFSWLLIAITKQGHPLIIDGAEDFWTFDLIVNGECALDNGVIVPKEVLPGALYRVDKISVCGGGPDHEGEYWGPEISGEWTRIYPPAAITKLTSDG